MACTGACSQFFPGLFADRVAFVTGGSTGIGFAIARELLHLGCSVAFGSRNIENVEKALQILRSDCNKLHYHDKKVFGYQLNVRNNHSIKIFVEKVVEQFGTIDLLVCNAGGQFVAPAANYSEKGWLAVIDTNLSGQFRTMQACYPIFERQKRGSIVTIVMNNHRGTPGMAHSGAARAGVQNLTMSLAAEWASDGIRVNAVAPGIIEGSGLTKYPSEMHDVIVKATKSNLMNRPGTEQEVAAAVIMMLSPGASYITGTCLNVDGGSSILQATYGPIEHSHLPPFGKQQQQIQRTSKL